MHILLVEDELTNQTLMLKFFRIKGYEGSVAINGLDAVNKIIDNEYDLVLMDVQMPVMDGIEATAIIRKLNKGKKHIPIIALTAYAMENDRKKCFEAGMDDFISKPVNLEHLHETIIKWSNIVTGRNTI